MSFENFLATRPELVWVCILIPGLIALVGVCLMRKWIKPHKRNSHHEIAHAVVGPIATVFSILGAFMIATTWHEYETTKSNLNEESNCLRALYFNAKAFTPETSNKIKSLCKAYRKAVLEHEWKIVVKGQDDLIGDDIINQLANVYFSYPITKVKERFYFDIGIENLEKIRKYREQRIEDSGSGLLPLLWFLFLLGGGILIYTSLLMISSPSNTHGIIVLLLAIMIGIMSFTIISLDFPFIGFAKISTIPFDAIPME